MTDNKKADLDFLEWLVKARSANQEVTLKLHSIVQRHREAIAENGNYVVVTQGLTGVCFSLWRAVFLADINIKTEPVLADTEYFLENLVHHNAVNYAQDRRGRHFSFSYYMNSARFRLNKFVTHYADPKLLTTTIELADATTPTDWWDFHHAALERAVKNFEKGIKLGWRLEAKEIFER